jgi:hypothetical protein
MSDQKPVVSGGDVSGAATITDSVSLSSKEGSDIKGHTIPPTAPPLAGGGNPRFEGALGDWVLRTLRIRKGRKHDEYDLDAVSAYLFPA